MCCSDGLKKGIEELKERVQETERLLEMYRGMNVRLADKLMFMVRAQDHDHVTMVQGRRKADLLYRYYCRDDGFRDFLAAEDLLMRVDSDTE